MKLSVKQLETIKEMKSGYRVVKGNGWVHMLGIADFSVRVFNTLKIRGLIKFYGWNNGLREYRLTKLGKKLAA